MVVLLLLAHVALGAAQPPPPSEGQHPFSDLTIDAHGGWGFRQPQVIEIPSSGAEGLGRRLSQFIHGVANHPELHSPIVFRVHYPTDGRFIVVVRETSGYGGAGLTISIDGTQILRRDFPGETDRIMQEFAGEYAVDVPAGEHEIRLDNPGRDWTRIRGYRLERYVPWRVDVDEAAGVISLHIVEGDGAPLVDATVSADIVGRTVPMPMTAPGVYRTGALRETLERGLYPVKIRAERRDTLLCRTEVKLTVRRRRLQLLRAAYPFGERIQVRVMYRDETDQPISGARLSLVIGDREIDLAPGGEPGAYQATSRRLKFGPHEVELTAENPSASTAAPIVVHRPFGASVGRGLVRLRTDGRFEVDGEPWLPIGFAGIHVFQPTLDSPDFAGDWIASSWCNAPDQAVADWLATLSACGINVIRIGLTVKSDGVEGDVGGDVRAEFIARFRRFLEIADVMGLRVLPVLYWGHWDTYGLRGVARYEPLMKSWIDWYRSEEAIRIQQEFVRKVASEFAGDPRIFAWEPMNEIHPAPEGDPAISVGWTNAICETLREVDPDHLITISSNTADPGSHVYFSRNSYVDFVNYHWYPDFVAFADDIRDRVAAAGVMNQLGPKPAIIGELGWTGRGLGGRYPQGVRLTTRDFLWLSVLSGSRGAIGWDGNTTAPGEYRLFSRILTDCKFAGLTKRRSPEAVVVRDPQAEYGNVTRYEYAFSISGTDYDVVGPEGSPTAREWPGAEYRQPALGRIGIVTAGPGYRSKVWVGQDGTVLAYVRNCGGIDGYGNRVPRERKLELLLLLPARAAVRLYDLNQQRIAVERGAGDRHEIKLGPTTGDYVIWASPNGF